jgi:CheY-like chemotaxis protein
VPPRVLNTQNPRSILIVDDDDEVRSALKVLLEASDLQVVGEATNGIEGGYMAYRHQPKIVILDYQMPKMNGAETSYVVRFLAPRCNIVAFSTLLEARPSWADAYLNKGSIIEIVPLIEKILLWPSRDGQPSRNDHPHRNGKRSRNGHPT